MAANDFGGLKADRLRVKITREGRQAGRFTKYGGQIGFKNRDGQYTNRWVDLMVDDGSQLTKGDVVNVTGRMVIEDREYNGKQITDRVIWVESMSGHQPNSNGTVATTNPNQSHIPSPRSSRQDAARGDSGEKQGPGFPSEASGMDDVPFAFLLVPLAGLMAAFLMQGGVI